LMQMSTRPKTKSYSRFELLLDYVFRKYPSTIEKFVPYTLNFINEIDGVVKRYALYKSKGRIIGFSGHSEIKGGTGAIEIISPELALSILRSVYDELDPVSEAFLLKSFLTWQVFHENAHSHGPPYVTDKNFLYFLFGVTGLGTKRFLLSEKLVEKDDFFVPPLRPGEINTIINKVSDMFIDMYAQHMMKNLIVKVDASHLIATYEFLYFLFPVENARRALEAVSLPDLMLAHVYGTDTRFKTGLVEFGYKLVDIARDTLKRDEWKSFTMFLNDPLIAIQGERLASMIADFEKIVLNYVLNGSLEGTGDFLMRFSTLSPLGQSIVLMGGLIGVEGIMKLIAKQQVEEYMRRAKYAPDAEAEIGNEKLDENEKDELREAQEKAMRTLQKLQKRLKQKMRNKQGTARKPAGASSSQDKQEQTSEKTNKNQQGQQGQQKQEKQAGGRNSKKTEQQTAKNGSGTKQCPNSTAGDRTGESTGEGASQEQAGEGNSGRKQSQHRSGGRSKSRGKGGNQQDDQQTGAGRRPEESPDNNGGSGNSSEEAGSGKETGREEERKAGGGEESREDEEQTGRKTGSGKSKDENGEENNEEDSGGSRSREEQEKHGDGSAGREEDKKEQDGDEEKSETGPDRNGKDRNREQENGDEGSGKDEETGEDGSRKEDRSNEAGESSSESMRHGKESERENGDSTPDFYGGNVDGYARIEDDSEEPEERKIVEIDVQTAKGFLAGKKWTEIFVFSRKMLSKEARIFFAKHLLKPELYIPKPKFRYKGHIDVRKYDYIVRQGQVRPESLPLYKKHGDVRFVETRDISYRTTLVPADVGLAGLPSKITIVLDESGSTTYNAEFNLKFAGANLEMTVFDAETISVISLLYHTRNLARQAGHPDNVRVDLYRFSDQVLPVEFNRLRDGYEYIASLGNDSKLPIMGGGTNLDQAVREAVQSHVDGLYNFFIVVTDAVIDARMAQDVVQMINSNVRRSPVIFIIINSRVQEQIENILREIEKKDKRRRRVVVVRNAEDYKDVEKAVEDIIRNTLFR